MQQTTPMKGVVQGTKLSTLYYDEVAEPNEII